MLPPKPRLGIRRHYNSQDRAQIGCDCNGFGACGPLNQVFDLVVNSKGYRASVRIRHASRGDGNEDDEQHRGGARSWRDALTVICGRPQSEDRGRYRARRTTCRKTTCGTPIQKGAR